MDWQWRACVLGAVAVLTFSCALPAVAQTSPPGVRGTTYLSPDFGFSVAWSAPWTVDPARTSAALAGDALGLAAVQAQALIAALATRSDPAAVLSGAIDQRRSAHPDLAAVATAPDAATVAYAVQGTPSREYVAVRPLAAGASVLIVSLVAPQSAWSAAVAAAQAIELGLPAFAGAQGGTAAGPSVGAAPTLVPPTAASGTSGPAVLGRRTKTSGCRVRGALPDPDCTPGAVLNVGTDQICQPGYARSVRDVPTQVKGEVFAEYGIASHQPGEYEVDHLVSLELGGSNDIANLWPEAAEPRPGFHEKDKVENWLHDRVCAGATSLAAAQLAIATNWLAVYQQMGGG